MGRIIIRPYVTPEPQIKNRNPIRLIPFIPFIPVNSLLPKRPGEVRSWFDRLTMSG